MNSIAEVDVLGSTYCGVFTAVGQQLTLSLRLRLRFSFWWSTGVDGQTSSIQTGKGQGSANALRTFSLMRDADCITCRQKDNNQIESIYCGVYTALGRREKLSHRLTLCFSFRWSTRVDGRAISGQFSGSSLDPLNRPPVDLLPRVDPLLSLFSLTKRRLRGELITVCKYPPGEQIFNKGFFSLT
ncbi:hypothetical protein UY3_10433 [Chelonia mydas]|uniref:Uncharacterized protein n=1 Tax=Chelonia mydas TaxID=8469 RepID=M7B3G2_CHEMY|nr:hypothetical protein UY3_10433 [Chelonia mydas]